MSAEQLEVLASYTACDVSDALLKLGVPGAGFLADIKPIPGATSPSTTAEDPPSSKPSPPAHTKVIATASTALFVAKNSDSFPEAVPPLAAITQTLSTPFSNIPSGTPYADLTLPDTVLVISQPADQSCAVVGGIMAVRMAKLGAKAVLVHGRVRDLSALRSLDIPIWSRGTSIIGAAAEAKAWATNVPVQIGHAVVEPGDVVMVDGEENGVVCVPKKMLERVLEMLPRLVRADEEVMKEVLEGGEVGEAFRKYRS